METATTERLTQDTEQVTQDTDKQLVRYALERMPENATMAEIIERLTILAKIYEGVRDIEEGRLISHEELKRRLATWTGK